MVEISRCFFTNATFVVINSTMNVNAPINETNSTPNSKGIRERIVAIADTAIMKGAKLLSFYRNGFC